MRLQKYWRELYLTLMIFAALAIIIGATFFLRELAGLGAMAVGVFIAVLGVGLYDKWQAADPENARARVRR